MPIAASRAAEPAVVVSGGTALEGLPDLDGVSRIRLRDELRIEWRLAPGWTLGVAGDLRWGGRVGTAASASEAERRGPPIDESDLYRLGIRYEAPGFGFQAGRLVRMAWGGLHRVDGVAVEIGGDRRGGAAAWAGRVRHPEANGSEPAVGAGIELRLGLPGRGGRAGGVLARAGWQGVRAKEEIEQRFVLAGSLGGIRGAFAEAGGEVGIRGPGGVAPRAGGRAWVRGAWSPAVPLRVSGSVRWEGLPPPAIPPDTGAATESLLPEGYGVGEIALDLRGQRVLVRVSGGPTMARRTGVLRIGGTGQAQADLLLRGGSVGVLGAAAAVGGSWYAGGGASARGRLGPVLLALDGGVYRYAGLDLRPRPVGEARFRAEWMLPLARRAGRVGGDVRLVGELAGGADRVLAPWFRAGVAVAGVVAAGRPR